MFGKERRKRYIIRVTMFDEREVQLMAAKENWGQFNGAIAVDKNHPLTIILREPRTYFQAVTRCMSYWRMGIDTCILRN